MTKFAGQLLAEWRRLKLPLSNQTVVVALSGGADSTALFLALDELRRADKLPLNLCVAHLDHGLRETSRQDAKWVTGLAMRLGYQPVIGRKKVAELARAKEDNLEQTARLARYEFLERTAKRKGVHYVLTAHTMDDQAETVLLRLMRGSAGLGLSGMESIRPIGKNSTIKLVRPLLWARRDDTENYCRTRKIEFLVDEMNHDESFARVKVRKQLLPLMQSFNTKVVEALSRTADLLRDDGAVLISDAGELLRRAMEFVDESTDTAGKTPSLSVVVLSNAAPAIRRRALREWISEARGNARRLEMVHLVAVEKLLEGTLSGRIVELPNGVRVKRNKGRLEIEVEKD